MDIIAALAVMILGATAGAPGAASIENRVLLARPGDSLFIEVGDQIRVPRVTRTRLSGHALDLRRLGGQLRGHVGGQSVEIALGPTRLSGRIGDLPISLDVFRSDNVMKIAGQFGARAISLDVRPSAVVGEVGPCWYDLAFQQDQYAGRVNCGAQPSAVLLRVPELLLVRGDLELAAMLTAVFVR